MLFLGLAGSARQVLSIGTLGFCLISGCAASGGFAQSSGATAAEKSVAQMNPPDATNKLTISSANRRALNNYPLQFGRPFVAGEIGQCPRLLVDGRAVMSQADVKTRYADGSVQFAIVSAVLTSVPASGAVTLSFADGACSNEGALTAEQMLGPDFDYDTVVSLNGGAAGRASARKLISQGHVKLWTAGPVVTTVIVADHTGKSADFGVDANRSVRPSFEVQFWPALKQTRTRVVMEISDTEKIQNQHYSVAISSGASRPHEIYSRADVEHIYMSRWTKAFWQGPEPSAVNFDYNVAYLARTKAIPNYDASIKLLPRAKSALVSAWHGAAKEIYDKGMWTTAMGTAGGRPDLGPYPKWMVAWLYEGGAELREVALGQADLAGAWPMHLREGAAGKFVDRNRTTTALGHPVSGYARPTLAMLDLGYDYTDAQDKVKLIRKSSRGAWSPDNAHQPQPFFIPYLLTGEHFYKEQLQFWSGFNLLDDAWGLYGSYCYSKNVSKSYLGINGEIRGIAWGMRMLGEAAWATPDSEPGYRRYLHDAYEDVVTRFEGTRGIVRDNNTSRPDWKWANTSGDCYGGRLHSANPLHYWSEGNAGYDSRGAVKRSDAIWMYAFLMYSMNRGTELGLPAKGLKNWFSPFFIRQVLDPGANPYWLGAYTIPVIDANTGALYRRWADVAALPMPSDYKGAHEWPPAAPPNTTSSNGLDQGYGTVALAALASTYGEPGSAEAWSTFAAPHFAAWGWEREPTWAILPRADAKGATLAGKRSTVSTGSVTSSLASARQPSEIAAGAEALPAGSARSAGAFAAKTTNGRAPQVQPREAANPPSAVSVPAWLASKNLFQWFQIPATKLSKSKAWTEYKPSRGSSGQPGVMAYSGGTLKTKGSELFIAGGGHADYAGNEIFSVALGTDKPSWTRRNDPSVAPPIEDIGPAYYPDGRPAARHTYSTLQFINSRNLLMFFGAPALWSKTANSESTVDAFDPVKNDYLPAGSFPSQRGIGNYAMGVVKDADENVYIHSPNGTMYRWDNAANSWSSLGNRGVYEIDTPYAIDTKRNQMIRIPNRTTPGAVFDLRNRAAVKPLTLSGSAASSATGRGTLVYDPTLDVYWLWRWNDSTLYRIDAATFEVSEQNVSGAVPPNKVDNGIHEYSGRFAYVPELQGLLFMRDPESEIYFIRTSGRTAD